MNAPPAKRHFQGREKSIFDELIRHNFDLSKSMGDALLADQSITSLQTMRDVFAIAAPADAASTATLNDKESWLVAQRRHIVVHKRGIVDRAYCEQTNDPRNRDVGKPLLITADDVEAAMKIVVKTGSAVLYDLSLGGSC